MKGNETIKEIESRIDLVRNMSEITEDYRMGVITGLEIAKEIIENFKGK